MKFFEYIDALEKPFDIFYSDSISCPMHWHYYSEILYMLEGSLRVLCNDTETTINKGELCYIYPLQLHEIKRAKSERAKYAVIKFDIHSIHIPSGYLAQFYDRFLNRGRTEDKCLMVGAKKMTRFAKEAIFNAVEECARKDEFSSMQIEADIHTILLNAARAVPKKQGVPAQGKKCGTNFSVHNILEYIESHSSEPLSVERLAQKCNVSYPHFARLFRETYGRSCKEYILYIRLQKAEEMLLHTDYALDYISEEAGFFDVSHFIRAYKKWKGVTPKRRRMEEREKS